MGVAVLGISVPVFVTAPLLMLVFAIQLHWLPAGDWIAGSWRHLLLPLDRIGIGPTAAYIARIVRAAAIDTLRQPYHSHCSSQGTADSSHSCGATPRARRSCRCCPFWVGARRAVDRFDRCRAGLWAARHRKAVRHRSAQS